MNTMTATVARPTAPPAISNRWLGLSVVLAATIMNLLDSTVVNVAALSIYADLGGSLAALQWIAAGYTLALAVGLLTGGRLGDMYGRKRMLMVGVAGFTVTSLACALAWSPGLLVGSRVFQGLFAAVMIPQCFGLIRDLFPPQDIGKAFAAFGPVIGLSTVIGRPGPSPCWPRRWWPSPSSSPTSCASPVVPPWWNSVFSRSARSAPGSSSSSSSSALSSASPSRSASSSSWVWATR
jgi:hypothetical protein